MYRRTWIKMWVKLLRDKEFMKMDTENRWVWVGLLLLAGDSPVPGKIGISEEMGYSLEQIAHLLAVDTKAVQKTISLMGDKSLVIDMNGVITINKWEDYQSEYQRQLKYRKQGYIKKSNSRLQPKVTHSSPSHSVSPSVSIKSFIKPNIKDIEEYAKSISFTLTGSKFFNYYEARGWKYKGNVAMKDWKAAVRTWKENNTGPIESQKQLSQQEKDRIDAERGVKDNGYKPK